MFGWKIFTVQQDTFTLQDKEQVNFSKEMRPKSLVGPSRTGEPTPTHFSDWKKRTRQPKFDNFYQYSQPFHDVKEKVIGKLEFVQGINFEAVDSLKKLQYKELVDIWQFMWKHLLLKNDCCYCFG